MFWYTTCEALVAKSIENGSFSFSGGYIEVYSEKTLALFYKHPIDNTLIEFDIPRNFQALHLVSENIANLNAGADLSSLISSIVSF